MVRPLARLLSVLRFVTVTLLATATATPAFAQLNIASPEEIIAEVDAMWARGDTAAIEARLLRALASQRHFLAPDDHRLAETLGRLCRNSFNAADYRAAEAHCREGLAITAAIRPEGIEAGRLSGDLAAALRLQGRFVEAEPLIRRSLEIRLRLMGPDSSWVASGLDNLARSLFGQNRWEEAAETAFLAFDTRSRVLGATHPLTIESAALLRRYENRLWAFDMSIQLALLGVIMAVLAAFWRVRNERKFPPPRFGWLAVLLATAGIASIGLAVFFGGLAWAVALLPQGVVSGALGELLGYSGVVAGWALFNGVANLMRRRSGLARQPFLVMLRRPADWDSLPHDVRAALQRAHARAFAPAMAIFMAMLLLPLPLTIVLEEDVAPAGALGTAFMVTAFTVWFAIAIIVSSLWGRHALPRWRVWALEHVAEIATLERAAIESGLLYAPDTPFGRWVTRWERWSEAQRQRARPLLRGRAGPAWSGDL